VVKPTRPEFGSVLRYCLKLYVGMFLCIMFGQFIIHLLFWLAGKHPWIP
jgi:hypothetical protein